MNLKSLLLIFCLFLSGILVAQTSILLTSPKGYSERFSNVFAESHLNPVPIPMIETVIDNLMPDVSHLVEHLDKYEYVAFSSRKAIESFYQEYERQQPDISQTKFCAVGKDIEYLYEKLGVRPAIIPDEPSPMGIANKLGEDKNIKGKTIACLVPAVIGFEEPDVVPNFLNRLVELEMSVFRVTSYFTRPADEVQILKAVEMIANGEVQCVAFTSSGEVEILLENIEDKSILDKVTIACFGPYTSAFAKKRGLKVEIIAKDFSSFGGFLQAIEAYYQK